MTVEIIAAASVETGQATEWEEVVLEIIKACVDSGKAPKPLAGFLGGYYSYGTECYNDVFQLHPFCYCEAPECPWCWGCGCKEEDHVYTVDGKQVDSDTHFEFVMEHSDWQERSTATIDDDKKCHRCLNILDYTDYGQIPNGEAAPQFWHKPSGFRMYWYKFMGRDTEIYTPEGFSLTPEDILQDCLQSLQAR